LPRRCAHAVARVDRAGRAGRSSSWARTRCGRSSSPAAALLRLLVVRLPADCLVLHSCGATFRCWLLLAPMLAADCWPALVQVHVHRGQLHRDARDHRDPAQLALHAWLHPQDLWWRAVMTLISALHLTYAGSHSASLACSRRMASLRSSYRCAEHWCWLRAAWASGASKRAAWLWRCCWPSGARGLLHHNHLVCTRTLA